MSEAIRYFNNAKETLSKSKIEDKSYIDDKYVKSAFGILYLGILKAIDENLLKRGLTKSELPKSIDAYREALKKHLAIRNGRLMREFENIYDQVHIAGYYRGLLHNIDVVKIVFKEAKTFIDKIK